MKYTYRIPPSSTETILTIDIPPATAVINQEAPLSSMSGGTPIPPVVEPSPVVTPPVTGALTRYMDWSKPFVYGEVIAAKIGEGYYNTQSAKAGRIVNAVFPGTTTPAMKMIWEPGDSISSSFRSEVQSVENPDATEGKEVFIGFSFYPEVWDKSLTWGQSIWQLHDNNGTSPSLSLQINDSVLQLCIVNAKVVKRIDIAKWVIGKKYDFVLHFKYSNADGKALSEVYVDGVLATTQTMANLPASGGGYTKIGLNYFGASSSTKTRRVGYYGPYKVGNSYNDVKP